MNKLMHEVSKRIMAVALSIAMIMSNMTVYAAEVGQNTRGGDYKTAYEEETAEDEASEDEASGEMEENKALKEIDEVTETDADELPIEEISAEEISSDSETSDFDNQEREEKNETDETVKESAEAREVDTDDTENKDTVSDNYVTLWDFSGNNKEFHSGNYAYDKQDSTGYTYNGLKIPAGAGAYNNGFLYVNNKTISIPVMESCIITASTNFGQSYYFKDEGIDKIQTGNAASDYSYEYKGEAGYVDIVTTSTTYFTKITVAYFVDIPSTFAFNKTIYQEDITTSTDIKGIVFPTNINFSANQHIGMGKGTISIGVPNDCDVTVGYYYQSAATIGVGTEDRTSLDIVNATGTNTADEVTYKYRGGKAATVTIESTGTTYITMIKITESSAGSGVEVALSGSGLSLHNLSGVELIFTDSANNAETYYVGDEIEPGSDTYTVELGENNSYFQGVTLSLAGAVNGKLSGIKAGSTITINYSGDDSSQNVKEWNLSSFANNFGTSAADAKSGWYQGLKYSNVYRNSNYLYVSKGNSVKIPVNKPSIITAVYYSGWPNGQLGDVPFDSTGTTTYWYEKNEEGYVELKSTGNLDLEKITITEVVSLPTEWDFTAGTIKTFSECAGLTVNGSVELRNDGTNKDVYISSSGGSMLMNVPGNCNITVLCHDSANATIGVGSDVENMELSEGTQSFIYKYRGDKSETIKINATGATYINRIQIEEVLNEWDFSKLEPKFEGNAGYFKGLYIDATASGSKFAGPNNGWAQANSGTIIKVPVDGPSNITVQCMGNGSNRDQAVLTVGGVANKVTGQKEIFECKEENKYTDGYVTIKMTANDYINYIKVEPIEEEDTFEVEGDFTIDFYDDLVKDTGKYDQAVKSEIKGVTFTGFTYTNSNNHGAKPNGGKVKLNLKQSASIIITGCQFGSSGITIDSGEGEVVPLLPVSVDRDANAPQHLIRADKGTLTLTVTSGWIHKIELKYVDEEEYVMTVNSDENGTATADKQIIVAGETVTLTAEPKDISYRLKEWQVVSESSFSLSDEDKIKNPLEITMPAEDVEIKAVFEESGEEKPKIEESFTLDFYAKASEHTKGEAVKSDIDGLIINNFTWFDSSNNHGIQKGNNATMELNLKQKAYLIVTTCAFATSGNITSDSDTVTVVPLGKVDINNDKNAPQYFIRADEGEVVLNFTVGYLHKIELVYVEADNYVVSVSDNGNGSVSADPKFVAEGEQVILTAEPDDRYEFSEWEVVSGETLELTDAQKTTNPLTIMMPAEEVEIKAIFEPIIRREWDFVNDETLIGNNGRTVEEGKTGTVARLDIDATATGSGWDSKVTAGGDGALAKNGTKITIHLESIYSKIEIAAGTKDYKVNGKAAANAEDTFECESKDKTVVINMTADNHIKSIKVTPIYYAAEGLHDFTLTEADFKVDGFEFTGFTDQDNSHGFVFKNGAKIKLNLKKKANIGVLTCAWADGTGVTLTSNSGTVSGTPVAETGLTDKGMKFIVLDAEGEVTLTFGNSKWLHNIIVEYIDEIEPGTRNIDVWDFGGKAENNTSTFQYNNNITVDNLKEIVQTGGAFKAGPASFGDLTMYQAENDKLYTDIADLSDYNASKAPAGAQYQYDDYTAAGMWYGSNTGSSTSRYVEVKLQAGDKLIAYMGSSGSGDIAFVFEGQIGASGDTDSVTIASGKYEKCVFTANKTGVYKIYATGKGKPAYHRFMRIPGVGVSGTIDFNGCNITGSYIVKFKNLTTKKDTVATVNADNSFRAVLAPGYTYRAVLSGAKGFGFTTNSSSVEVGDEKYKDGISGVDLVIETKPVYEYSGKIIGFAPDYERCSDIKVTMIADEDSESEDEPLVITLPASSGGDITFAAKLDPLTEYTFKLEGVNDYEIIEPDSVCNNDDGIYTGQTIKVALKSMYDVTGGFQGLPVSDTVAVDKLTFTNLADEYVYEADINEDGKGYSVKLRDGEYVAAAEVTGYSTSTHVVVNGGNVSRDLLFVFTGTKDKTEYVEKIYVGYTDDRAHNYSTVNEAMEACRLMERSNASQQRITISIAPGEYREQIIVDVPYVSFVNESNKEVLLTWYYGIGYKYYSSDASGYYNPQNAYDKFDKHIVDRWGVATYIKSGATGFRAEGITFENSFNRYITDEELEDGVEVSGTESIAVVRNYNTDVTSNAATERAAAIAIEADQAEFKNCGFYSSQDTLYTQGSHIYFKNCVMEGETDYIYGSGNCVFDACELSRKGYSDKESSGYITANSPLSGDKGYLFRNCTITANRYNKLKVGEGYFGRPWGQNAIVIFMNTKLQSEGLIKAAGWEKMGDATAEKANFWEYNTTTIAGAAVDTSKRVRGVMEKEDAEAVHVTDYFGGWTPYYYAEEDGTPAFEGAMSVTNNADINAPHPGNTLTVHYSLGAADQYDASRISWYIVDSPESETGELVKTSVASVDKTYQIETKAEGKYIRVMVTPETFGGKVGEPKSFTVEQFIREGWNDPTGGGDITLGDGVNIFLAGDSTVMDYSAKGMYNGGKSLNEGSWGEFLQAFFNDKQVTIQNYAQGGRSSRTFLNEGKLDSIKTNMSEGDYLFIQFGHNDCADDPRYIERYVPVGTPDADGIYPTTPGEKDSSGQYPNTSGTFKWYLKQYIDAAREKDAIPVLVTPVSRMYYDRNGNIRTHHDDSKSSNNAYVTAMKQLAEEENVLLIDGFELTKTLFEEAWKADGNNNNTYGLQIMQENEDTTHNNKLGGLIEAALIAGAIQDMNLNISKAVKAPRQVLGAKTDGTTVFSINKSGELTAYDLHSGYVNRAPYWEMIGQALLDAIDEKANNNKPDDPTVDEPVFSPEPDMWNGEAVTLSAPNADKIRYTTDGSEPTAATGTIYESPISITETTTIKAVAVKDNEISKVVTRTYTVVDPDLETLKAPVASKPTGTYDSAIAVTLTVEPSDAVIYYTLDGNEPNRFSTLYTGAITISESATLKAFAVKEGYNDSPAAVYTYTINSKTEDPTKETAAMPTAEPESGSRIKKGTVIKLFTATQGAEIHYTMGTDPADPTDVSALYDSAKGIEVTADTTIKAFAIKDDLNDSPVATFKYTVYEGNVNNEDGLVIDFVGGDKYTYTGSAITPAIVVTYNNRTLFEGVDYSVKYSNNIAASVNANDKKMPMVTVTGKGDLAGKVTKTFEIEQRSLADTDIKAGSIAAVVNKKASEPILYYNGIKLTKKNYQLAADQSLVFHDAGEQKLTVEGIGNFKDTKDIAVKVYATQAELKAAIKKLNVTVDKDKVKELVYTGDSLESSIKECITVKPKDNGAAFDGENDYIIALPNNLTSAGTVKFTVIGLGDYSGFTAGKSIKILPKTIAQSDITTDETAAEGKILISGNVSSLSYVGTGASNGSLSLTWNGRKLIAGKDYKISYSGNKKVGSSAKYTLTFIGNYKGKYTSAPFEIKQADLSKTTAKVIVPDMVAKKDGVYKAKPYVTIDGVTVNASEYIVEYYVDSDLKTMLDKNNQVTFGEEAYKTVYVKIVPKNKNYKCDTSGNEAVGRYKVWLKKDSATDLSKAKITFHDENGNKITKLEYQGGKTVEPYEIKVNGQTVTTDKYHCYFVNNVNKGKATVVINAIEGSGCIGGKTAAFSITARTITKDDWLETVTQALNKFSMF